MPLCLGRAAAVLVRLEPAILEGQTPVGNLLDILWQEASPDQVERNRLVSLIEIAWKNCAPGVRLASQIWRFFTIR